MVPHDEGRRPQGGELSAAISSAIVQLLHRHTGRGPTRARTTLGDDVIVCVLSATRTRGEQSLVDHDYVDVVLRARAAYQDIMKREAVAMVEQLTGRTVAAFMSCNHLEPDVSAEVFVLEPRAADLA